MATAPKNVSPVFAGIGVRDERSFADDSQRFVEIAFVPARSDFAVYRHFGVRIDFRNHLIVYRIRSQRNAGDRGPSEAEYAGRIVLDGHACGSAMIPPYERFIPWARHQFGVS
jgi:hypothetical protein